MRETRQFTYVICADKFISLPLQYCKESKTAILWNYKGLFGLIPYAKIQNAYINNQNITPISHTFFWKDVFPVHIPVAKLFLCENENYQCTYR